MKLRTRKETQTNPPTGIDWPAFTADSDDYRNVVLLRVCSAEWAKLQTYSQPSIQYQMAEYGYRAIFLWVCRYVPAQYFSGADSRKETAAELASEFLRFVLPGQAVDGAEQKLLGWMQGYQCGPIGRFT